MANKSTKLFSLGSAGSDSFWTHQRTTDGAPVWNHDFYPASVVDALRLEAQFVAEGPGFLTLQISPYFVCLDDAHHQSYVSRTVHGNILKHTDRLTVRRQGLNRLRLTYAAGKVTVVLNGNTFTFRSAYRPTVDRLRITWPRKTTVRRLAVWGRESAACVRPPRVNDFAYHMVVDFPDDVAPAPFDRRMLADMMTTLARLGYRRLYWIYYAGRDSGFWDDMDLFLPDSHVKKTFARLGNDDLKVAAELAHQAGLEIYAVIKPFDLSIMGRTFSFGSPWAERYGKCDTLGGRLCRTFHFPAEHPELCLRRRPCVRTNRPIDKIVITACDKTLAMPEDFRLWVSRDNHTYERYGRKYDIDRRPGTVCLRGLNITEAFVAVEVSDGSGQSRLANTMADLIHMYTADGREIPFTYGLTPRVFTRNKKGRGHLTGRTSFGGDFRTDGFFFDYLNVGIPSGVFAGEMPGHNLIALDGPGGGLGLAVGKSKFVPGVFCPSEPKARTFWRDWIRKALECGVDGVDLRVQNHSNVLEWKEYGFNPPVVREFKKRYGIDPRTEKYNAADWRRLRGEFYTRFLREAGNEVHARGKKLQLHFEDMMEGTPELSTMMEVHWDWRAWLDEGICDAVTLKALNADSFRTHFGREVIRRCREKNIPIYLSAFMHDGGVCGQKGWRRYLGWDVRDSGLNGFIVYEHSFIYVAQYDGTIRDTRPEITGYLKKLVGK